MTDPIFWRRYRFTLRTNLRVAGYMLHITSCSGFTPRRAARMSVLYAHAPDEMCITYVHERKENPYLKCMVGPAPPAQPR